MRAKTPSFILELPLKATVHDTSVLTKTFDAGRQLYNACLGEANRRYYLMKQSKEYQRALRMPKPTDDQRKNDPVHAKAMAKARTNAFSEAADKYEFTEYALSRYATKVRNSWLREHIESTIVQKLSKRAFEAVQKKAFGLARRVRFKSRNALSSIEGKSNRDGLKFREGVLTVSRGQSPALSIPATIDKSNAYQGHGLQKRVKYCRLIRRNFNGKTRFSVQLILEGKPYLSEKHPVGSEEVGLDIGPSTLAYVGDTTAELRLLCAEIVPDWKATRRLQRKMDRSRRATNPDNYNANGTTKKGKRLMWRKSTRYRTLQRKLAEANRKLAAHRKSLHGELANDILKIGCKISTEKIAYRAWQKMFGKSILVRAPSMIVSLIRRKAENAHGHLHEIPTQTTALSQTCHICGVKVKKTLSQRWHNCCGMQVQRDLYSAFLAKCCVKSQNDTYSLDRAKATALWPGAEQLLKQTISRVVDQENLKSTIGGNSRSC